MVENSKIEWTDHTFSPWTGCQKVSPACDHCYAEAWSKRSGIVKWGPGQARRRTSEANWKLPAAWNRRAAEQTQRLGHEYRPKVFCASLADVFDNQVDRQWRVELWNLIAECHALDWLLLTKRPQNITKMLPIDWGSGWHHVWLGTTVENQEEADRRIIPLLRVSAQKHFLSCEPLLESLDLSAIPLKPGHAPLYSPLTGKWWHTDPGDIAVIDWVITGGESGPGARPMDLKWAEALRDQCAAASVPFFMKQIGGTVKAKMPPIPASLMVREFPA